MAIPINLKHAGVGKTMNKRTIVLAIIAILALAAYFGPNILEQTKTTPQTGQNSTSNTGGPLTQKQVDQLLATKESKLKVKVPANAAKVSQQFTVTGEARVPGQTIRAVLKGKNKVLVRGTATMKAESLDWTSFTIPLALKEPYKGPASLEVYWLSPKNGERTDIINIPVSVD